MGVRLLSIWSPCLAVVAAVSTSVIAGEAPSPDAPPNVVFILADDLGYGDLGSYGQRHIATPHLDRLAADGMRFTQAYAGAPVCTASRAVLMTGRHNGHTPARDNVPHFPSYLDDDDVTVAEVLQRAGYRTGGFGKWSLGDPGTVGRATAQGFDTWFGYLNQDHAHYYWPEYLDDDDGRVSLTGNGRRRDRYSHDVIADRAIEFLRDASGSDRAFFLYLALTLPHYAAPGESADGLSVPGVEPYADRDWPMTAKKYAAMVHRIDQTVGRITTLIDRAGLAERTLIVFTSDNGGHSAVDPMFNTNGPLRGHKRDLYEGGIRVPMIVRRPGTVPGGVTSDAVVAFQDVLPTLADLADIDLPADIDGVSLRKVFEGETSSSADRMLYWDYGHCRERFDQAVRLGRWKAIQFGRGSAIELYDLMDDPSESNDIADAHPDVVSAAADAMEAAFVPHDRYPVGTIYRGGPIWKPKTSTTR